MVSAPANQPLAVDYNKALAEVLGMLTNRQLAELSIKLRTKASYRPTGSNPDAIDLALTKVEVEAAIRCNRNTDFNPMLYCVLTGSLSLPEESAAA